MSFCNIEYNILNQKKEIKTKKNEKNTTIDRSSAYIFSLANLNMLPKSLAYRI